MISIFVQRKEFELNRIILVVLKIFDNNVEVVNNFDWTKDVTIIDFLRDIGKYINVNYIYL